MSETELVDERSFQELASAWRAAQPARLLGLAYVEHQARL